jgi:hypothetical protein
MKHSLTNVFRLQYIALYLFIFQIKRQKKASKNVIQLGTFVLYYKLKYLERK